MTTNRMPHATWETTQGEAESFADSIKSIVEATLVRLSPEERAIYCQHLANVGNLWGFQQQAIEHDNYTHGKDCPCDVCCNIWGLPY
jgi:hypothetical protein